MRAIRTLRAGRLSHPRKRRRGTPLFLGLVLAVAVIVSGGVMAFRWFHPPAVPQGHEVSPGMIYLSGKPRPAPVPSSADSHAPAAASEAGNKKEKEEQYTFYKTLPAKNEQIVPLTPDKKKEKDRPMVFPPLPQEKTPAAGKEGGKANPADEFTVQVAALKERKSAEDFVAALKAKGREAYILPLKSEDHGTLYRVRVGHYPTKKDALKLAETLSQEGLNSFVVKGD